MSQSLEEKRAYDRAYRKRPGVGERERAWQKAYDSRPETKNHKRTYLSARKAEVLAYSRAYRAAHAEEFRLYHKAYQESHREEIAAQKKVYHAAHRERKKSYDWQRLYGLSRPEFLSMLDKQGGVCAICKKPGWNGKWPHIDHDHATGRVRGILCSKCNPALGMIDDDPAIARAMAIYLEVKDGG